MYCHIYNSSQCIILDHSSLAYNSLFETRSMSNLFHWPDSHCITLSNIFWYHIWYNVLNSCHRIAPTHDALITQGSKVLHIWHAFQANKQKLLAVFFVWQSMLLHLTETKFGNASNAKLYLATLNYITMVEILHEGRFS